MEVHANNLIITNWNTVVLSKNEHMIIFKKIIMQSAQNVTGV